DHGDRMRRTELDADVPAVRVSRKNEVGAGVGQQVERTGIVIENDTRTAAARSPAGDDSLVRRGPLGTSEEIVDAGDLQRLPTYRERGDTIPQHDHAAVA